MRWAVRLSELDAPPHRIVTKSTAAVDLARELTVEDALETGAEWLLFLDSDVVPPRDVFYQLRSRGLDVVSGMYYVDTPEQPHPAMWRLDEQNAPTPVENTRDGVYNVDTIGLGCLLLNRSVLEDVDKPWFRWTRGYEDHPWDLQHQGERPGVSEDFFFCHKLKEAGHEIYMDTTVECIHEKTCFLSDQGMVLQSQLNPDFREKMANRDGVNQPSGGGPGQPPDGGPGQPPGGGRGQPPRGGQGQPPRGPED